jgi:hypothetical protein
MRDPPEDALWSIVGALLGALAIISALIFWIGIVAHVF